MNSGIDQQFSSFFVLKRSRWKKGLSFFETIFNNSIHTGFISKGKGLIKLKFTEKQK